MRIKNEIDPVLFERVPFESEEDLDLCPSCNVTNNRYHHVNCSSEECPQCAKRLKTCECDISSMIMSDGFTTGIEKMPLGKQIESYHQIVAAIRAKTSFFLLKPDLKISEFVNPYAKVKVFEPSHTADKTLICQEYRIRPGRI